MNDGKLNSRFYSQNDFHLERIRTNRLVEGIFAVGAPPPSPLLMIDNTNLRHYKLDSERSRVKPSALNERVKQMAVKRLPFLWK